MQLEDVSQCMNKQHRNLYDKKNNDHSLKPYTLHHRGRQTIQDSMSVFVDGIRMICGEQAAKQLRYLPLGILQVDYHASNLQLEYSNATNHCYTDFLYHPRSLQHLS